MSYKCPDLPFLPGYTFNPMIGKTKFNMDPKFDFIGKGVRALVEKVKPNMFGALSDKYPSVYARGEVAELPGWVVFDKQILCFDAYFKETLQEVHSSPYQVRKVKIYFFLEDGTIQVVEPKIENSGVAQGTLITRHRIRFPEPMSENFYDLIDLNVGKEVEFYGRVFKITNCDIFTRNFLNRCGISVPDPVDMPYDPYLKRRYEQQNMKPQKANKPEASLKKFLDNDRKVLQFQGYWDDQETEYGYLHYLEIYYYLADDTIQIKEIDKHNPGAGFMFLKRTKLPKTYKELPRPGANATSTLLNVLPSGYVVDPLDCGREIVEYYTEKDFSFGSILNCYGRKIVLTDCSAYTKEYYRVKYGIDEFEPKPTPPDNRDVPSSHLHQERELPPWNGFGTYEDSAQNCITVELKAPLKDFKKFLNLDRKGLDSHILRFGAKMMSKIPENCHREFIISYFLANETIGVFEYARRNSGFDKKQFLKREQVQLPGQNPFSSKPPLCYTAKHMFVGAELNINGFVFRLINADEYALRYMEINSHLFPKSNIKLIIDKIREKLRPIYKQFVAENICNETQAISYQNLREKLLKVMGTDLTEHEMITLSRAFALKKPKEPLDRNRLRAVTLTELKRSLWNDLERLREYFLVRDTHRSGKLSKQQCYTVLRACRLPLDPSLINKILQVVKQDCDGNIEYGDILDFVNRDVCPMPDVEPINIKHDLCLSYDKTIEIGSCIDWFAFNKALDLEKTLKDPPIDRKTN